ncbi:MAG: ATPase [Desulfuromonadaceae bacterium]|nr:ATPase [Desulfuromonadaceae bacterium]
MNRIVALTPADADNGFACCGAVQHAVAPGQVSETLAQALDEAGSGVVILDERLVGEMGEEMIHTLERRWSGVLVVLPAPGVSEAGEDYAMRLIRKAVGYQVKVRT